MRIALLNDYDVVVKGLQTMLQPFPEIDVVELEVGNVEVHTPVDVALYDTYGRRGVPWEELKSLVAQSNAEHVAVFTFEFSEDLVARSLEVGVHGYLWKGMSAAQLVDGLRGVERGDVIVSRPPVQSHHAAEGYRWPFADLGLTMRESEVLALLTQGLSNPSIAEGLFVGVETVRSHLKNVYAKLGVHTRGEAIARALRDPQFDRAH